MWQCQYYSRNNELYHYGVKGMKWGVRKKTIPPNDKNKRTKMDEERKKRIKRNIAIGVTVTGAIIAAIGCMYVHKKLNKPIHIANLNYGKEIDINKLSDIDTVLNKKTRLQRISSKSIEDYSKIGRMYVSFDKKDNRIYKEEMPKFIKEWNKKRIIEGSDAYVHSIKVKNDIKVASKKKVAEVYLKTTGRKKIDHGEYYTFMEKLSDYNKPEVKKFFNEIEKMGYNAIVDENDAGNFTRSPLILINPEKNIESSKKHKLRSVEKFINVLLM